VPSPHEVSTPPGNPISHLRHPRVRSRVPGGAGRFAGCGPALQCRGSTDAGCHAASVGATVTVAAARFVAGRSIERRCTG
jgi:hypothetical protein